MNAVIIAFLLCFFFGWALSALAFTIVWLAALIIYAVLVYSEAVSFWQGFLMVFYVGVAAQIGYFANVLLRSIFVVEAGDTATSGRTSWLARFFRAMHLNIGPRRMF